MEHPLKLESDPVDPDQVGCVSDASGTAVLGVILRLPEIIHCVALVRR